MERKKNYEAHFLTNTVLNDKIKKKSIKKMTQKQIESTRVNYLIIVPE
jgi:hypothetical protein